MEDGTREITLFELEIFAELSRRRSLRSVARARGLTPSHVSKVLSRLEKKLDRPLLKRSASGVFLSPEGKALLPSADRILQQAEQLDSCRGPEQRRQRPVLSIGSVAFLNSILLAGCLGDLEADHPQHRYRLIDIYPDELLASGMMGAFELAVHIGELSWTRIWHSRRVGELRWGLIGRSGHPVGTFATEAQIKSFPFVVPSYWTTDGFSLGNDHFVFDWNARLQGHEVSTVQSAIEIVRRSDHLVFAPLLAVKSYLGTGELQQIQIKNYKINVAKSVYLSVREDLISASLHKTLLKTLERQLSLV